MVDSFIEHNTTPTLPQVEGEKKEKKPRAPKADGEKKEKKPRAPKADGEKKEKKPRAPKGSSEKKEQSSPVVESPVESPVAEIVSEKINGSPSSDPESSNSSMPELTLGVAAVPKEKKEKKEVDYSNITAVDAAVIKPLALKKACKQHGIDPGNKATDELRTELIQKLVS